METLLTKAGVPEEYQHIAFEVVALAGLTALALASGKNSFFGKLVRGIWDFWKTTCENLMGEEEAKKHTKFIFSIFLFILFMNLMGLVPGLMPPTMNINTNIGIAVFVFLYYNYIGFRKHGVGYIKHFLGPFLPIAFLYFPIEVISHFFRIVSLSVRLAGNMTGDHAVLEIFTHLTGVLVPVAFLVLGTIVSIVQAFVFAILSAVYIALAVGEEH